MDWHISWTELKGCWLPYKKKSAKRSNEGFHDNIELPETQIQKDGFALIDMAIFTNFHLCSQKWLEAEWVAEGLISLV